MMSADPTAIPVELTGVRTHTTGRTRPRHSSIALAAAALFAIGVLMRLNNAFRYPSLHGFDGYAHVTYVWHLLRAGDLPLANEGWGRFHPPLYYLLCAGLWQLSSALDPGQVLKIISLVFSVAGLASVWVSWAVARRYFAAAPTFALLAPAFVLYLPVHIYVAPMLGNESLTVVLCSVALLLLLRLLEERRLTFAVALGITLGLALLTKVTAIVIVGAAGATIACSALRTGRWREAAGHLGLVLLLTLIVAGWFYARNVRFFGNPFQMSRGYFVTRRIESSQPVGGRGLGAYLTFDPSIFREPSVWSDSVVDSVWTGAYATTWFDAFENWFLPYTPAVKVLGRVLLVLGIVPTGLMMIGFAAGLWRLLRSGWNDVLVIMVITTVSTLAMFVVYTHANRIVSALKASYMLPGIVAFGFWFALGTHTAIAHARRLAYLLEAALVLLVAVVIPTYTYQLLFEVPLGAHHWNAMAVVDYFAGFRDKARTTFAALASQQDLYLAHENLASMAIEDGHPIVARRELRRALRLLPVQALAGAADRAEFVRLTRADYYNSLAVIDDSLDASGRALRSGRLAVQLDPTLPEAQYDLALLLMKRGAPEQAIAPLRRAMALDPGFADAAFLLGVAEQRAGKCADALHTLDAAATIRRWPRRLYPHAVGEGDFHDAAIVRHRRIAPPPAGMRVADALAACGRRSDSSDK